MSNRFIKFLEEIGANQLTIDFAKKNVVTCGKCKHVSKKYDDFDDLGMSWYYCCKLTGDDCDDVLQTGLCMKFEKKPWWKFWSKI